MASNRFVTLFGKELKICLAYWLVCCSVFSVHAVNLTLFEVRTTIQARFATTRIKVVLNNPRDCAEPTSFGFLLPNNARVTSLVMNMSDGCDMSSDVKSVSDAKNMFEAAKQKGQAAAMLSARSSSHYAVQAMMPPLAEATIIIEYGELLKRRRGLVDFTMPLAPSIPAAKVDASVSITDAQSGVRALQFPNASGISPTISLNSDGTADASIDVDAKKGHLSLAGSFDVGPLPEDGLLMSDDDGCVVHLFNPPSLQQSGALRKNIVFVIDVSGSMGGQKLLDAKVAFRALLNMLTIEDAVTIHTFSNKGAEGVFGPKLATETNLAEAAAWVDALETISGTNLNDAYIDGLTRVHEMQELRGPGYVPIIVVMSDGQATSGVTDRSLIMQNVGSKNQDIKAKIYSLAFGAGADFMLLMGIALQNGGVATMIYEGYGDSAQQMQDFIQGEIGSVLLSDISVLIEGPQVQQQTQTKFPVLADGSEVAVRARIPPMFGGLFRSSSADCSNHPPCQEDLCPDGMPRRPTRGEGCCGCGVDEPAPLRVLTNANAYSSGTTAKRTWTAVLNLTATTGPRLPRGDCVKAFAHGKILELMNLRDAARQFGNALSAEAAVILSGADSSRRLGEESIVAKAEAEALRLAIEAQVVWPGLTAMIAVQGNGCSNSTANTCATNSNGIGESAKALEDRSSMEYDSASGMGLSTESAVSGAVRGSTVFTLALLLAWFHFST